MNPVLQVSLTADVRAELRARLGQRVLAPRPRLRLEAVRLSDRGWNVTRIAEHLEVHHNTVRRILHRFQQAGLDGLDDRPRSGRPAQITSADLDAVGDLLDQAATQGQTWTLPQLRGWLASARGVRISAGRLGVLLNGRGFRWKRTKRTVAHKADPARQQQARAELAGLQQSSSRPPPG